MVTPQKRATLGKGAFNQGKGEWMSLGTFLEKEEQFFPQIGQFHSESC